MSKDGTRQPEHANTGDPARCDEGSIARLIEAFAEGARWLVSRELDAGDLDAAVDDILRTAAACLRSESVLRFDDAAPLVHEVLRRELRAKRDTMAIRAARVETRFSPEQRASARAALDSLAERDAEVVRRLYIDGHTPERICEDMKLSNACFVSIKSRARTFFSGTAAQ